MRSTKSKQDDYSVSKGLSKYRLAGGNTAPGGRLTVTQVQK